MESPSLIEYVTRLVTQAPPLDDAQRAAVTSALAGHLPAPAPTGRAA